MPGTIAPLLKTTFDSILEVFIVCAAGYILARKGILDRTTQKKLNRLNVSLFTPSLLFSKVAFFLSPAKLRELWIIPLIFVVVTVVSMTVAYVFSVLLRLKRSQRSFAIAASMFMNSNSLPIALMQSLVTTVPGLKWDEDDNKNAMVGRALTYLVLYSTLGMMLRWSYGVRLLSQADPEPVVVDAEASETSPLLSPDEQVFPQSAAEEALLRHAPSSNTLHTDDTHVAGQTGNPSLSVQEAGGNKIFYSFPNSPGSRSRLLPTVTPSVDTSDNEEQGSDEEFPARRRNRNPTAPPSTLWQSRMRRVRRRVGKSWKTFNEFMTVPLWAAVASIVVACIGPLQHALDQHMTPIKGAINNAGKCSIPITLVVLGAYFYVPPEKEEERLPSTRSRDYGTTRRAANASSTSLVDNVREMFGLKKKRSGDTPSLVASARKPAHPGETKTVLVAILSRMIITPLLLLPLMTVFAKYDLQEVFEDPVFVVANVLLIASPPALTLAQITQAASGDAFERLISKTIFWSYCAVTPPSTIIFVVIGMILAKL